MGEKTFALPFNFAVQPTSPPPSYGFINAQMPQPEPNFTVTTQQPNVVIVQQAGVGKGSDYKVGLCNVCHNCHNLCLCAFCSCYVTSKITGRLEEHCCYPSFCGVLPLSVRFRTIAGIEETMCNEAINFTFCYPCAVLRLANEMEERNFTMSRQ